MKYFIEFKDFLYYNRKLIISVVFIVLILLGIVIFNNKEEQLESVTSNIEILEKEEVEEEKVDLYVVDIKGLVKNPGTYEVSSDKRVIDVINMAGGISKDGDLSKINLSKKVEDEMVIIVPSVEENSNNENSSNINENIFLEESPNIGSNNEKISINSSTFDKLLTIKGIGEVKAKAIIEYRNINGAFKSIEEIKNVKGIGNSTFEKIKDYIKL